MNYIIPIVTLVIVCAFLGYLVYSLMAINENLQKFLMVKNDPAAYNTSSERIVGNIPQKNDVRYNRYVGAFMSGEIDEATLKELGEREPIIQ